MPQSADTPIIREVTICNARGMHARPSARMVETARSFQADVIVTNREGESVSADSIMGLLMLAASEGQTLELAATGKEAEDAINAIEALIASGFGENE